MEEKENIKIDLVRWVAWMVAWIGVVANSLMTFSAISNILTVYEKTATDALINKHDPLLDLNQPHKLVYAGEISTLFILGMIVVSLAVIIEVYFRRGQAKDLLWKRIGLVYGIELIVAFVLVLIQTFVR